MSNSNIEFKAMPGQLNVDEAQGIVECFVAGIGNKDSVGDVLVAGAFAKSLMRRKPRVVWGHNWNDPIGKVLEIYEVPPGDRRLPAKMLNAGIGGLYARVQFNLNSEKGREAFANVAFFGQEQEWSIGYKTLDAIFDPNIQANVLREVELYEVSPVLHGANQLTGTISVKSDELALADEEKGWGMMGPHHMMGQPPMKPNVIVIREDDDDDDDKYESEKPIFAEGLAQPISGMQRQRLEKEIMERTGSQVRLIDATENTAVFQRMMPNGTPMTFRIGYHTPDNYSTFMFGKPELANGATKPSQMPGKPSGSRVVVPSQMPAMPMQVKPGYDENYGNIMPKSDIAGQLSQLEDILMDEIGEKVGRTINKRNLAKLKSILENLQDVISSAEKEDMETKGYLIPVELENAFETKSMLDPIFDYHRVESVVTEDGILITSGVTKDLMEAIDNAQKGIGRTLSGGLGKGRAAGRAAFSRFDPNAWDGDGDGLVQEGTPFQRPAIPGVNDFGTRGRIDKRRAAQAFASVSPTPEVVSGELTSNLSDGVNERIEQVARSVFPGGREKQSKAIEALKEISQSLSMQSMDDSLGGSLAATRRALVEKLSDKDFIELFDTRKQVQGFVSGIDDIVDTALFDKLEQIKKTGKQSDIEDFEDITDELYSEFSETMQKISKKATDFWDKRKTDKISFGSRETSVEKAAEYAQSDLGDLLTAIENGLEGEVGGYDDFISWLSNQPKNTITRGVRQRFENGEVDADELQYELSMVLEGIQEYDPTLDPEELVNSLTDSIKKGAEKNPLLKEIADSLGDDRITGGDLIDELRRIQRDSPYAPERGNREKEKLRGFASVYGYAKKPVSSMDDEELLNYGVFDYPGLIGINATNALRQDDDAIDELVEKFDDIIETVKDNENASPGSADILSRISKLKDKEKIKSEIKKILEENKYGKTTDEHYAIADAIDAWAYSVAEKKNGYSKDGNLYKIVTDAAEDGAIELDKELARENRGFASSSGLTAGDKDDSRVVKEMAKAYPELSESDLTEIAVVSRVGNPEDVTDIAKRLGVSERRVENLINEFGDRKNRTGKFASQRGLASSSPRSEKNQNSIDMTLEEYGQVQDSINKIIDKLEQGDFGADEEIDKLKEITDKIDESIAANDIIPLEDNEINDYLGMLESMRDGGVGMDDISKADKENIDGLIDALKEAQKTGSSESQKLKDSGTRLATAGKSTRSQTRTRRLTSDGTLTPQKNLSITLDEDAIGLLVEEADLIADNTKDRQSIMAMKKILEDAKGGKFEVTPEQFDSITKAIEDAIDNGLVSSDIYGVLHQAAESSDGKYDINDFVDPPKPKKGFASTNKINNGAPSDITESMQKQFVAWARQQKGLRIAQSIIADHDRNNGQLKASQWKALRTMYGNMGPGSGRGGGFRNVSRPTAGFRDIEGPQGIRNLPYVHQTSGWKKVGGAGGLNEASVMQDPKTGKKYYVKHTRAGEEFRGESEILTSKLYQLLGIGTINYERGIHNGKLQRVSEWNPNINSNVDHRRMSQDPGFRKSMQGTLIANAWLANWDGTGNMSNIVELNGQAVMADSGGGLLFRAQRYSGMKGEGGTDSFGPRVEEVYNLINGTTRKGQRVQTGVSNAYYKDIEPEEVARQVKELGQVTDDDIKKLVAQTISNPEDGDRLAQILIARRDWIVDHWKTGQFVENPADTSRSDASGAKARPFASVSGRTRGFASSVDGPGDDERGGGRVTARGVGQMVPGGNITPGRERREGERNRAGTEVGAETRFAGKKFEEVKPDNWDDLTLDEKWQWALTYGNPDNSSNKDDALSQVEYRKLLQGIMDDMDKEDLDAMTPAERRAEKRRRAAEQRELDRMGYMPENSEALQPKKRKTTVDEDPDEIKPIKIKKSKNAEEAAKEREARLDGFLEGIDMYRSKFNSDMSENDDHRDVWDKVSDSIQEGDDFTVRSLDRAIEALDEYIGEYEEAQLSKEERVNIASAKAMRKQLAKARAGYANDEWIPGNTRQKSSDSDALSEITKLQTSSKKLATDIKKDIKRIQGSGKPGTRGFASTSAGGKTMITDEATFFRDVEKSLDKEIRRATKAGDKRAQRGLSKLAEIIRRDEASKTGSRRTNVGSIYFTADEADEILDGLMFALDTQLEDGGEKRVAWYSQLIEMIAKAAKSTFIDKTTREINETTRTATNSRGQQRTINIVPEA